MFGTTIFDTLKVGLLVYVAIYNIANAEFQRHKQAKKWKDRKIAEQLAVAVSAGSMFSTFVYLNWSVQ